MLETSWDHLGRYYKGVYLQVLGKGANDSFQNKEKRNSLQKKENLHYSCLIKHNLTPHIFCHQSWK